MQRWVAPTASERDIRLLTVAVDGNAGCGCSPCIHVRLARSSRGCTLQSAWKIPHNRESKKGSSDRREGVYRVQDGRCGQRSRMVTGQSGVEDCGHAEVKRRVAGLDPGPVGHPSAIWTPLRWNDPILFTDGAALTVPFVVQHMVKCKKADIRSCDHISLPFPTSLLCP